jgi:hypothetical protein
MYILELVQTLSATLDSAISANPWVALLVLVGLLFLTELSVKNESSE